MKKRVFPVAIVLTLCGSMLTTSCIGNFSLTKKLLSWNNQIDNKFVNELVFFLFWFPLPVYEVAALADILVLNSIEFWSGENPMAAGKKVIDGKDGRYIVECDGKGYTITSENDKSVVRLNFNADEQSWNIALPTGESRELFTFIDEKHVSVPGIDGVRNVVELSEDGLMAYREMLNESLMAAK